MAAQVFSEAELDRLRGFPEIDREQLVGFFTLTPTDEAFVRSRRGPTNRLGMAVQLCTLPWLGFVPDDVASAPTQAVQRLAERLRIPVTALSSYGGGSGPDPHRSPDGGGDAGGLATRRRGRAQGAGPVPYLRVQTAQWARTSAIQPDTSEGRKHRS